MTYCEDCGCKIIGGHCVNCHEEVHILNQYIDQDMELPDDNSEFMKKVATQVNSPSKPEEKSIKL